MATIYQPFLAQDAVFGSTSFPQLIKTLGTNFPVMGLSFDASTKETCFFEWPAISYGSGNLTLEVIWYAANATSGDVIFGAQITAITPNSDSTDVEGDSLATANTVTDTHLGTTSKRLHSCSITISNLDSIAAGDRIWMAFYRDAAAGGDTMANDCVVTDLLLSYSDT